MKSCITYKTAFEVEKNARQIKVIYLLINAPSSYNLTIGYPSFNHPGFSLSTLNICMNPLPDGRVGVNQGDQKIAWKCYIKSLKFKKASTMSVNAIGKKFEAKSRNSLE